MRSIFLGSRICPIFVNGFFFPECGKECLFSLCGCHNYIKVEHTDSKCDFLKKSKIYRLILCNVFFKMTHVLPLLSAQNCDKNALQNRRGRPVLNKIGSLTIVFSVFSFAKICQCRPTQFLPHHIYTSIKDSTMHFGSLLEEFPDLLHETILNAKYLSRVMISAKL